MAKAAPKTQAIANWDQRLADLAARSKKTTASIAVGGNFISLAGGIMKYKQTAVPNNTLHCVVLAYVPENDFFPGRFDSDNAISPVCYAMGEIRSELAPHKDSFKKQHETCQGCPQNEWGSAETGKGKACQNRVRVALISAADLKSPETIKAAEVAYLRIPVTSVAGWAGHAKQMEELYNHTLCVITQFKEQPHEKHQFEVLSSLVKPIEDKNLLGALIEKSEKAYQEIIFPYPPVDEARLAAVTGGTGRKPAAKPARKKAAAKF